MSCSIGDGLHGEGSRKAVSRGGWWPIVAVVAVGVAVAGWMRPVGQVQALTSLANDAFAVCTLPLDGTNEGVFILDFETGDLSGAILNPATGRFGVSYKHNVLADLGFKPGQVKNPKFLLVAGLADLRRAGNASLAQSVLYVTDSSTGTTVAYGIPWSMQQPLAASPLVPLDIARPRGAAKAK
jgi:hypothetical protein